MVVVSRENNLARHWWVLALRGVLAFLFGVIALLEPSAFWWAVVIMFAAAALVDGSMSIAAAILGHVPPGRRWALVFRGVLGIAGAAIAVVWAGITELALYLLIAGWCVVTGVFEIVAAVQLRQHVQGSWLLVISGILSVILGSVLALFPLAGMLVIAWWVGASAIAYGIMMVVLAFWWRAEVCADLGATANPAGAVGARVGQSHQSLNQTEGIAMSWSWRIGRIAGIDVYIHFTFLLLLGWVAVEHYLPDRDLGEAIVGLIFILALFGIVVLHELGHASPRRRYGISTRSISRSCPLAAWRVWNECLMIPGKS